MGTTSNYNWPTPVATDLVKNGWEAIKDLGDAADTTVKAISDAQGLVHIETRTMSAVSAESFNDVFTSAYENYKIILWDLVAGTGTPTLRIRVRASGTDLTTNTYAFAGLSVPDTGTATVSGLNSNGLTSSHQIATISTQDQGYVIDVTAPNVTARTGFHSMCHSNGTMQVINGKVDNTLAYDGFTIYPSSSTITGFISVYGFRK